MADQLLVAKIVSMCLLGGISLFVGLIPIIIVQRFSLSQMDEKSKNKKAQWLLTALNCFGAGVILTTCFTQIPNAELQHCLCSALRL